MSKTAREYAQERREAGKCSNCAKPAVRGSRCEKHWLESKEKAAARYKAKKAKGLCGVCGKNKPEEDQATCLECIAKARAYKEKVAPPSKPKAPPDPRTSYQKNKDKGRCQRCPNTVKPGHVYCEEHLNTKKLDAEKLKAAGLCKQQCGNLARPGFRTCQACRDDKAKKYKDRKTAGQCVDCPEANLQPVIPGTARCELHTTRARKKDKKKRLKHKDAAFKAYGGYRCNCLGCDQTDPDVLAIDHVNNDGAQHRREIGATNGSKLYRWLRDNNYPSGFQVLCFNCNRSKALHGVCKMKH